MTQQSNELRRAAVDAIDELAKACSDARAELVEAVAEAETNEEQLARCREDRDAARNGARVLFDAATEALQWMEDNGASVLPGRPAFNLRIALRDCELTGTE
jgi:hypothetical protein